MFIFYIAQDKLGLPAVLSHALPALPNKSDKAYFCKYVSTFECCKMLEQL